MTTPASSIRPQPAAEPVQYYYRFEQAILQQFPESPFSYFYYVSFSEKHIVKICQLIIFYSMVVPNNMTISTQDILQTIQINYYYPTPCDLEKMYTSKH